MVVSFVPLPVTEVFSWASLFVVLLLLPVSLFPNPDADATIVAAAFNGNGDVELAGDVGDDGVDDIVEPVHCSSHEQ